MLSDLDLRNLISAKRLVVTPFEKEMIRENGIDMTLSNGVGRHKKMPDDFVMDPYDEKAIASAFEIGRAAGRVVIGAHEHVLLSINEYLELPDDLMALVELRSTLARHGLSMPPTYVDAGYKGTIVLEVVNNAPYKISLKVSERFAHMIFIKTLNRVIRPYTGGYQGQRGVNLPKKL